MAYRIFSRPAALFLLAASILPAAGGETPLAQARRAAAQGNWKEADALLEAWKNDPLRRESGGQVFFWQGWAALHRHLRERADTLLTLASAYADDSVSQRALEYRFALSLDSGEALYAYLRGLPESPLPDSARAVSLRSIPASSPLHSRGLWELARLLEKTGDTAEALSLLRELSRDLSTLPGRNAQARRARLQFEPDQPDSALAGYERLLLQYQQGVPSELARSRVQALRDRRTPKPSP